MILIPKAFERVADAASRDETRPVLSGVHVMETATGTVIEATDGQRMIRATLSKEDSVKPEDYPVIPGFDSSANGASETNIPVDVWRKAFKAVPKPKHMPILGYLALTMEKTQSTLASTDLQAASITPVKPSEGMFPNVNTVIPKDKPVFSIAFDATLLADTLEALAVLSDDIRPIVRLEFHGPEKAVRIVVCHAKDSAQVESLVMPMRENR